MSEATKSKKQGSNLSHNLIRNSVHAAIVAALAAASVAAQAQTAPAASGDQAALQEVVVTGSRIKRADIETPSPIQVVSAEDLKASGYTTISQVLSSLTANGAGTLSNSFPGAFAGSATGVSLRGLNTSATLVMIDGHRMAPFPLSDDGQRSFVDLSSLPFDAVDRIEVLKDGASAVYGSDAMAGVVNVILKKDFVGTTGTVEAGTSQEGGGTTEHASVMHGMGNLASDGYNAYVSLEYRHQGQITQRQREGDGQWANLDQSGIGGINQTPGIVTADVPIPPTFGTVYLTAPGPFSAATSDFYGTAIKPVAGYNGSCTYATLQAGGCGFVSPDAEVQPSTENINFLASFKKTLGTGWLLDLKASAFNSRGEQQTPSPSSNGLEVFPTSISPIVAVSASNPIPVLVGTTVPQLTVPANYPGNTLGVAAFVRGVPIDAGSRHTDYNSMSYRLVADVTGSLLGWDVDTSAGYTRVNLQQWDYSLFNRTALYAALNRPTNPYLITGDNTAADLNAIYPVGYAQDQSTLEFGELNLTRSLATLPGGDLGLSGGAQVINRELNAPAPALVAEGLVNGGNNAFVLGSQVDSAAYLELAVPIVKMLEVDGHVRYDHFNNSGSATTPSVGFKFKPLEQIAFRGTWGRGFRAPNPAENGKGGQGYSAGTAFDPILCPGGSATTLGNATAYCNFNPPYENSTNPNLKPEKSLSKTLGVILQPVDNWSTTLDYFHVRITNQIVAGTADISTAVRGGPISTTCSNGTGGVYTCTTPVGPILYIPVEYVNANSTQVSGFELDSNYKFNMGAFGAATVDFDWSHMMSYLYEVGGVTYQLAGTHGPAVIGGNTGNPKDRVQGTLSWDNGPWDVRLTLNWISSFSLLDPSGSNSGTPVLTCAEAVQAGGYYEAWFNSGQPTDSKDCKVQSFLDTDLSLHYKFESHWTLTASITNLFNEQPPLDLNTYGGGNLPYNPSMHEVGAIGRFFNVGVKFDL